MTKRAARERTAFGSRMLAARNKAKLTQSEAAEKLGVGQSTVADAESTAIGTSWTPQAAKLFDVDPLWLACGEGAVEDPYPTGDWPFSRVDRARWASCSAEDRGYIQAAINRALDECDVARSKAAQTKPAFGKRQDAA